MVLNQMNRATSYDCGTANKCMNCNMMYMCARSPYCCIRNNNMAQTDLTPIQDAISGISGVIAQQVHDINSLRSNSDDLNKKMNILYENMSKLSSSVLSELNKISSKIDSIENKNEPPQVETEPETLASFNNPSADTSIMPYVSETGNDTVLVEKKGLFGKTKWIEEKKK